MFSCDANTASRTLRALGEFHLVAQIKMMEKISSWVAEEQPDLVFAACATMYDETGQKMSLPVTKAGGTRQMRTSPLTIRKMNRIIGGEAHMKKKERQ